LEPVDRARELETFLKCSASNWKAAKRTTKYKVLFAPQSQGSGKTFLGKYLRQFIAKDKSKEASVSVVAKVRHAITMPEHGAHYEALGQVNSLVIEMGMLYDRCNSLEEAVTVAIVAQLYDVLDDDEALDLVRGNNLRFRRLCKTLLLHQQAMVLVLDDVLDVTSSAYNHFFEKEPGTDKIKAAITLLRPLLDSVIGLPGMVVYLTGRSPEVDYKLIMSARLSPLFVQVVLMDAFDNRDIVELITDSRTDSNPPLPLKDALGLQTDEEVSELACFLEVTTAGVPRMVSNTLHYLVYENFLQQRAKDQGVFEYLASQNSKLCEAVRSETEYGFAPNWPSTSGGSRAEDWDRTMTKSALTMILNLVREGKDVDTWKKVEVSPGVEVTAVDLLSVLGVPYTIEGNFLTVRVGVWMLQSLLSEKDEILFTTAEARAVLGWMNDTAKWVTEATIKAYIERVVSK
jgi:hypothetical protein